MIVRNDIEEGIMRTKLFIFAFLFLIGSFGLVLAEDDPVLAKIGNSKITMADLKRIMNYYDPEKQKILEQKPQYKVTLVQRIVKGIVISRIAREKGFDKREDVKEQVELLTNDFLVSEYLKKEIIDKIHATEEDMQLYYKAKQEEFKIPEMVKARHIFVKVEKTASDEEKKKAKDKAEEILKRVKSGEDFAQLASELSDDKGSKTKGGDLGFFPRGRMVPPFEQAAFSLKPGDISEIVETPFGFHIIKVEEKKESVLEPYDKVKDKVKEKLFTDLRKVKVEEFIEKAMKDAGVEMNLEPLLPKK